MLLEALLLRSCALWQSFIESEIVVLALRDPSNLKIEMGLEENTKLNLKLVRALLFSDKYKRYYDLERAKGEIKRILSKKYDFYDTIQNDSIKTLSFVYKMRNYLSHLSTFSMKRLLEAYTKTYKYQSFLTPGLFLMKQKGKNFESLVHNFKIISISMRKKVL